MKPSTPSREEESRRDEKISITPQNEAPTLIVKGEKQQKQRRSSSKKQNKSSKDRRRSSSKDVKSRSNKLDAQPTSIIKAQQNPPPHSKSAPSMPTSLGRVAGEEAARYSKDFEAHSKLAMRTSHQRRNRTITELRWSDLQIGKLLGEGNFSHVYEVKLIHRPDLPDTDTVATGTETIQDDVWRTTSNDWKNPVGPPAAAAAAVKEDVDIWDLVSVAGGELKDESESSEDEGDDEQSEHPAPPTFKERIFALKHLHPQVTTRQKNFTAGAIDLVLEAKLLSCLTHPNIVKLYGVTEGSINNVFSGHGYFLLLDRLTETLEEKMYQWTALEAMAKSFLIAAGKKSSLQTSSSQQSSSGSSRRKPASADSNAVDESDFLRERAKLLSTRIGAVAIEVARGMEYLHSHRIVFRDLKPPNIGFTKSGRVKIFDFGLAREIVDNTRRLTGNTGSLRYMAPEVNRREHYGLPADVYSYGILLWEISALHKPFKGMSVDQHAELVIEKGYRPKISVVPGSKSLKILIQTCWSSSQDKRPTFTEVLSILADEVEARRRQEELEEIERQRKVAPKTGLLRMKMMRQRRNTQRASYVRSGKNGSFDKQVPFS